MMYSIVMERIYKLCPSIKLLDEDSQVDAIARMCVAHVLNGGEFTDIYHTAIAYLESVQ